MELKRLRINSNKMCEEYTDRIIKMADEIIDEYLNEIKFSMKTQDGKEGLFKVSINEEYILKRKIIGDAYAIIDSFGTGSLMDLTNPFLSEYVNSESYNELRKFNKGAITGWGIETGTKKDVFGDPIISSGKNKGKNLEEIIIDGEQLFEPIEPSFAFQQAYNYILHSDRIGKKLKQTTSLFINEIKQNAKKYMTFG